MFNFNPNVVLNNFNSLLSVPRYFALSTTLFDGNAFESYASSSATSESVGSQPPYLKQQLPTTQPKPVSQQLSKKSSPDQFQLEIQQWFSINPQIASYKAEESLARLWVEQQKIFHQWEQQQNHTSSGGLLASPPTILLTTESVNSVLRAWCSSNNGITAAERAERLLHWMEDLHPSQSISEESLYSDSSQPTAWSPFLPKPNYQSYATVIEAWSCAAACESANPSPAINRSETETKSGGRAKNNVISPSTKTGFECARRAEDLLMHMQRKYEEQQKIVQGLGKSEHCKSENQPDTRVFNLVLKAWSKVRGGTKASAIRAMRILDLMQELHHCQSMNAPEWQGIVLSKVQPNLETYKLVINSWAHAAHTIEGPDRAEEILRHLLSLSKAGNMGTEIMPDADCFHIVMKAHADAIRKRRKGDNGSAPVERAQKVTALLDWMELLSMCEAKSKIRPTTESYRIALSAWVWSHHVDAPKESESILYRMIRAGDAKSRNVGIVPGNSAREKPNPDSSLEMWPETRDFNTVINCCSFARKVGRDRSQEDNARLLEMQIAHREIFEVAEGALDALFASPYAHPDSATFSGIIRACVNLLPNTEHRDDRVIGLFRLAFHTPPAESPSAKISTTSTRMRAPLGAGCVDANVLRQLRRALPSTEDYIRVREEFEKHRNRNVGE